MQTTCKQLWQALHAGTGGGDCSAAHRTAAYRQRLAPLPQVHWDEDGKELRFSTAPSRTRNADGTPALTLGELAERLLEIVQSSDAPGLVAGEPVHCLAPAALVFEIDVAERLAVGVTDANSSTVQGWWEERVVISDSDFNLPRNGTTEHIGHLPSPA
jgi:hypothetical protein